MKHEYSPDQVSSDKEQIDSDVQIREAQIFQQEQPYKTATRIRYHEILRSVPIEELGRRSDVMLTSTVSVSLIPKDKRKFIPRTKLDRYELINYIDEKRAYEAMKRELEMGMKKNKQKEQEFSDNYIKSFIHRSKFKSRALIEFKKKVKELNTFEKKESFKSQEEKNAEKLQHEKNKRAAKKKEAIRFDFDMTKRLMKGEFHDD